ncbi:MAG: hypothetical protein HZA08_00310 [Nitrospirae bacterium]|nr:hypothetical protein [Nitrospirota bacterium]
MTYAGTFRHRRTPLWVTPYEAMLVAIILEDRKRIKRLEKNMQGGN